jgi:cobalt/nickel transport system permease protein
MLAMHAPDGFLEPWMAVATAGISLIVVAWCARGAAGELDDRRLALGALTGGFVFSAQMLDFPVASGTTGHLLGAALAAIVLGPKLGAVVVTVVIVVQTVVFADGGITALGYNTINMAIVPAFGGWAVFSALRNTLPATHSAVIAAAASASAASVVLSAMAFSLEWLMGASAPVPFTTVFPAMVGIHLLIGIGEGLLSAVVVAAVLATRPDLVAGASDLAPSAAPPIRDRAFLAGGLLVTTFVATVMSQFAAAGPDGLERVAIDTGFVDRAHDHLLANSVFADYATSGVASEPVGLAVAGLVGVGVTVLVAYGMGRAVPTACGSV